MDKIPKADKVPHSNSKDVPENLREKPVEFFDMPLHEAVERGDLSTLPFTEAPEPDYDKPEPDYDKTETIETTPIRKNRLPIILGGTAASIAIAAGAVFGVKALTDSSNNETPLGNDPKATSQPIVGETTAPSVSEAPANPNANEVWYKEEMEAIETGPVPSELTQYQEMSLDDFSALSKAEQWKYVSWLTKNRVAFMDTFYKYSGKVESNKPSTLGPDSDSSDIITFFSTSFRQAVSRPLNGVPTPQKSGPSGTLDTDAVEKISVTMYTDRAEAKVQADALLNSADGQALSIRMLGMGGSFDTSAWQITSDNVSDEDYEGIQAKKHIIDYVDTSGKSRELIAYVYPVTTYDGTQEYVTTIDPNYSIN